MPGLVRIAADSSWRAATWGAKTYVRTGVGFAKRLPFGRAAVQLAEESADQALRQARRVLGVEDVERRLMRILPERVQTGARARAAAPGAPALGPADLLQQRGAGLLAQAADVDFAEEAHPAYARILDELAPDEARVLRLMATTGAQPAVDIRTGRPLGIGSELIAAGLTIIGPEAGCRYLERVPAYLNNLFRLGLIWFAHEELRDLRGYQVLEAQPDVKDAMRRAGRAPKTVRRSIALTPFGEDFCRTCLPLDGVPERVRPDQPTPLDIDTGASSGTSAPAPRGPDSSDAAGTDEDAPPDPDTA